MELTFATSESTAKLDAAIARVQAKLEPAVKDKTNPAFRSRYADLTAVWEACRTVLAAEQISVTQWPVHSDDGRLHMVTRVAAHGEWIRAHSSIPVSKQDPQGFGSALTYCKRYALASALGVVAEEDDDGNAASHQHAPPAQRPAPRPESKPIGVQHTNAPDIEDQVLQFGKHKGRSWGDLLDREPDYVEWAIEKMERLAPEAKDYLKLALAERALQPAAVDRTPLSEPEPDGFSF